MAVAVINRKERFATEGIRFQRHNPDGTIPTAKRFLGFANTADLSKVKDLSIKVKIDAETVFEDLLNFGQVADIKKVTVEEAREALIFNVPEPGGIAWSIDPKTNRLMGSARTGNIIQITGELAAAMDFGQGIKHGGNGLEMISFFEDEALSIGLPKDIKDKEEIDIEGAKGTITRMVIGAMIQGLSPVVTLKEKDYFLLEMIQGGKLNRENGIYEPPLSKQSDHPTFWAEVFSGIYSRGSNKLTDIAGYERLLLRSMIGMEGDVPIDAKAWAQYAFNLTATEYTDENGEPFAAWQEQTITLEDFDKYQLKKIRIE